VEGYEWMFSPSLARLKLFCIARIVHQNRLLTADLIMGRYGTPLRIRLDLLQDLVGDRGDPVTVAGLRLSLLPP
jgi:hypothetical protein